MRLRRALLMAPVLLLLVIGEGWDWGARSPWRRLESAAPGWQAAVQRAACQGTHWLTMPVRRERP